MEHNKTVTFFDKKIIIREQQYATCANKDESLIQKELKTYRGDKLFIPNLPGTWEQLMHQYYDNPIAGYLGTKKMKELIK